RKPFGELCRKDGIDLDRRQPVHLLPQDIGRLAGTRADLEQMRPDVDPVECPWNEVLRGVVGPLLTRQQLEMALVHVSSFRSTDETSDAGHQRAATLRATDNA